mmetsp:Transcript_23783/g.37320  ORF Transcript_23783/g.37320 Transcript_23783/m.37320 type:complete len:476 (-) Transcript_23783:1651-3078(-)
MHSSDEQVRLSTAELNKRLSESTAKVTEGRIRADQREIQRRKREVHDNAKKADLIQQSNDRTNEEAVDSGWKECLSATNAQDLCALLDKQKSRCDEAVTKLEEIGTQLCSQLREQDHEYITALRRNRKEIEVLQECIINEHKVLKATFEKELGLIEAAFKNDRKNLLETKQSELEALMMERDRAEVEGLELQRDDVDARREEIKQSQNDGNNQNIATKETLESELRRLEIALEDTRARQDLDTDKLEYDVRVLTDLAEDESAVKKQKRRIMKGKGELYDSLDTKSREKKIEMKENNRLERDCDRIERQTIGMREKFERFKLLDEEKYQAVLALHKGDLTKLQSELNQSQEYVFGNAIGCLTVNSDVTCPEEIQSCTTNEAKLNDTDTATDEAKLDNTVDFGLECEKDDSSDRIEEWRQAESLMTNYRAVLQKREELNSQAHSLKAQNKVLEGELSTLLKDKVNDELTFPPEIEEK